MSSKQDNQIDMQAAVTRSLLGWGVVVGPFYLIVGLVQALVRDGFDLSRHQLSLLMLGDFGWVQTTNLILSGCMAAAAAVGFARAMKPSKKAIWAGGLIAVYAFGLIASAIFSPDPMEGFPDGSTTTEMTGTGMVHLAAGAIGFLALASAALVVASWFEGRGDRRRAAYGRIAAGLILVGFIGGAALSSEPIGVLLLWVSVVAGLAWLAMTSLAMYRLVPHPDSRLQTEPSS